jgi:hypothetical protein
MANQTPLVAFQQHFHPTRTFSERCVPTQLFVLPAESLDDTTLTDPDTDATLPSLRQSCSAYGLCFARVIRSFAPGLYWAVVGATVNLDDEEWVILTESHLAYALPWDVRVQGKGSAQIRDLMLAQANELEPLILYAEPARAEIQEQALASKDRLVAPPMEFSTLDLQKHLVTTPALLNKHQRSTPPWRPTAVEIQQGLLQAILHKFQQRVALAQNDAIAQDLQAWCNLLVIIQDWQQQTKQRIVEVSQRWCARRNRPIWYLTLDVPASLLAQRGSIKMAA